MIGFCEDRFELMSVVCAGDILAHRDLLSRDVCTAVSVDVEHESCCIQSQHSYRLKHTKAEIFIEFRLFACSSAVATFITILGLIFYPHTRAELLRPS
jgi:hypothetical protein